MNTKYLRTKRDASHTPIVNELRRRGYSVCDLSSVGGSVPDILIADKDHAVLVELKEPLGAIYIGQLKFMVEWKGRCAFAKDVSECIAIMREPDVHCLTYRQKRRIDQIVVHYEVKTTDKLPRITVKQFEKLMEGVNLPWRGF